MSRSRRLWKAPPRFDLDRLGAVPAHLHDRGFEARAGDRAIEALAGGAGVKHHIGVGGSVGGQGKAGAQAFGDVATTLIPIDGGDNGAGQAGRERCDQQPHEARAHHHDAVAGAGAAVPYGVERGLHVGGQSGPARGHAIGNRRQGPDRNVEEILMRIEAENRAAHEIGWPSLDDARRAIAVFHRERKHALLLRGAHALPLAPPYAALKDQPLRTPADAAE